MEWWDIGMKTYKTKILETTCNVIYCRAYETNKPTV